ncbi:hypothetical protein ElyMa_003854000 [Elysia marginata]|uniref:Endonuclease/exonuclease/phosphatase domain-containing protein n=1 Tax=Elysia marginata TaxID=1093978 RepID=A0AAV4FI51_9GAST|nr:hypothetical protein ElyMa_003854000 [Elysia marginata]
MSWKGIDSPPSPEPAKAARGKRCKGLEDLHLEACRAASEVLTVYTMTFKILQWNIRGLKANLEELLDITKNCNIGIMAIQDSKLPEEWAPPQQRRSVEGSLTFYRKLNKSYKIKPNY